MLILTGQVVALTGSVRVRRCPFCWFVVAMALILQKVVLSSGSFDIIKGKSMRPTLIKLRGAKYPLLVLAIMTLAVIVVVPLLMIS